MGSPLNSADKEMEGEELSCSYKLVPWINWEEWNFVRDSLFSSSPDNVSVALKRLSAWRSRGQVPILVEITASIIEIQQKDPFFREGLGDNTLNSEEVLAMMYCMAIMRLVNGVVEKTRKKAEVSIAVEADRIGLPRMLIDIRHESSHRDLPSLQLVRLASVKALDWLKSFYWEPQKNAIPFQKERITNAQKKVRELAFYLNLKQTSLSVPFPVKKKRMTPHEAIYGHKKLLFQKTGKLQRSYSQGPKAHIKRTVRIFVRSYSSYPSDAVAALMEFLIKALESSNNNEVDPSVEKLISQNPETRTDTISIWKLIISRLSSKVPDLILIMLKELLEMIESRLTMKLQNGGLHLEWSACYVEDSQIKRLSSLVLWLIEKYKRVSGEIQESSDKTNGKKATLVELLKKCLLIFAPGNDQLAESALVIAHMIGNSSMVDRVKKLSLLSFQNSDSVEESSTLTDTDYSYLEQESSSIRASDRLDFLKRCREIKGKTENVASSDGDFGRTESRWRVANSWKPCPIGMLPSPYTAGEIPILDRALKVPQEQVSEFEKQSEPNCFTGKADSGCDVESLEESNATRKLRTKVDDEELPAGSFKGRLLIGGVWRKVGEEEVFAIQSAVSILV